MAVVHQFLHSRLTVINKLLKNNILSLLKLYSFLLCYFACQLSLSAQYYDDITESATCANLKTELSNLICESYTVRTYTEVRNFMCANDIDVNGFIIDRYANTNYVCSNFTGNSNGSEGLGWNREHVIANSWFGGSSNPAFTDIHNLFPSDTHANSEKSNLPLGEVVMNNVGNLSLSMIGDDANECIDNCNPNFANGEVFEPTDIYKGDFARVNLYMAVKYQNEISEWEGDSQCGDQALITDPFKFFESCYLNLLLRWHLEDPPSQLEIDRNDAAQIFQGNRNPFVDRPEYAALIWGNNCCPSCVPFTIEASPSCSSISSTFNIEYTINGSNTYSIIEPMSGTNMTGLSGSGTLSGFAYTNQNDKLTLSIIDELTGCIIDYDVLQLDCSSMTSSCDCTMTNPLNISVQASGNGNGYSMAYVLVDLAGNVLAVNQTGDFPLLPRNTNFEVYAFNIDDIDLTNFISDIQGNNISIALDENALLNDYCYTFADPAPFICVCDVCNDIIVDATTICDPNGGETYTIVINSITGGDVNNGAYTVNINGTDYSYPSIDFPLIGQPYSGNNQDKITLTVTDSDDSSCTTTYNVFELNCVEQTVCDCTQTNPLTINVQASGNANGFDMLYVLVDANGDVVSYNQMGNFPMLAGNMSSYTVYAVNYDSNDAGIIVDIDNLIENQVTPLISGLAPFDSYCFTTMSAPFSVDCMCAVPMCSITPEMPTNLVCNNNGTPSDPSDDTFTFDVTVNGSSTYPGSTNTFNDDQGNAGVAYGQTVAYGPFPISGGNITVNYSDANGDPCLGAVVAIPPSTCSGATCEINPSSPTNIVCNDNGTPEDPTDDTYTFDITVNGSSTFPSATNTFSDNQGNTNQAYGATINYGPYLIASGDITVIFSDTEESGCTDNVEAVAPMTCSDQLPCTDIIVEAFSECQLDGTYSIIIGSITGGTGQGMFDVTVAGTTQTYTGTQLMFTGLTYSNGPTQAKVGINIVDSGLSSCTTTFEVFELNCVEQTTCDCSSDPNDLTINVQANGEANGFEMYYILVDELGMVIAANATGSFPNLIGDSRDYEIIAVNYESTDVAIVNDIIALIGNSIDPILINSSPFDAYCFTTANTILSPDCMCCNISNADVQVSDCNDQGTLDDPSDDSFDFTLDITQDNLSAPNTGFQFDGSALGLSTSETGMYGPSGYTITGVLIGLNAGSSITITVIDIDNPSCTLDVMINVPLTCSGATCLINPDAATNILCNDNGTPDDPSDDTFTFDVTVNGSSSFPGASNTFDDDQMNSGIAYGTTQSYGPYPISGGSITVTFTDADENSCTSSVSAVAPTTCSDATCEIIPSDPSNIVCNDNGTPDDPTDDTFTFDLTVNGSSTFPGATNTFNDDQMNAGIAYGTTQSYGPYPISSGDVIINFTDAENTNCVANVEAVAPQTCSISCTIAALESNAVCDDNGTPNDSNDDTYTFTVTITGSNTDPNASNTFIDSQTGNIVAYGTTLNYGPFPITNSTSLLYIDVDDPNCMTGVVVDPPPSCSIPICAEILVDATTICAADGTYTIVINSISGGAGVDADYNVSIAGTNYSYPADFPLTNQVYSGGNQSGIILNVTDADSPTCTVQFSVFELNCLAQEVCDCASDPINSLTINAQATGNANGFLMLYILVDPMTGNVIAYNSTGSFTGLLGDNTNYTVYAVNYDINDGVMINDVDALIGSPITPLITSVAPFDSYCYTTMSADFSEDCGCVLPMCSITPEDASNIICDDNGTPDDPSDDTFTFDILVDGNNTNVGASNTFDDNQGNSGINYGVTISYGPYPISNGNISVMFTDFDDAMCEATSEVIAPNTCSSVTCTDIIVDATSICDPNGAETYSIIINTITGGDGSGTDYIVTINGTNYTYPVDFPLIGQSYSGADQSKITLSIADADDNTCTTTYEVFEINCVSQEVCDCNNDPFSYSINTQASADANGFDLVYIISDGTNVTINQTGSFPALDGTGTNYTVHAVHVESTDLAAILAITSQIELDDLVSQSGAFENLCYDIQSQNYTGDCGCNNDCSINNLVVTTMCDGSPAGVYDINICFNAVNPTSTNFTIEIDGQTVGQFPYAQLDANGCIAISSSQISQIGDAMTGISVIIIDGIQQNNSGAFISELHYDNDSGDENEGVEITAPVGTSLAGFQILAYNGNGGSVYNMIDLSGDIIDSPCGSIFFDFPNLQNGAPDGIAFVDPAGNVLEFISYEGSFTATSGPAAGLTSLDIGVEETESLIGESLQLTDLGWIGPITATPHVLNAGLTCVTSTTACFAETTFDELSCFDPCGLEIPSPIVSSVIDACPTDDVFVSIEAGESLQSVVANNIFFSEYLEGTSNNKCLEIFNGTGSSVDLTGWSISVFTNGNTNSNNTALPTSLIIPNGDVLVICDAQSDPNILALSDISLGNVTNFNGNDDIALVDPNGVIVDYIGTYASAVDFGTDTTFVRKCEILEGRTDSTAIFIPANEWLPFPIDDISNLGMHEYCGMAPVPEECVYNVYLEDPANGGVPVLTGLVEGFSIDDITQELSNPQLLYIVCINEDGCESDASIVEINIQDIGTISCEDLIQVSLGETCEFEITGELLFTNDRDINFYDLELTDDNGDLLASNFISDNQEGETVQYKLTDLCSGISCWGQIKVEVKRRPFLTSPCSFLYGSEFTETGSFEDNVADEYTFEVRDTCQIVSIDMTGSIQQSCGTATTPDWCDGTYTVSVMFYNIVKYTESGIIAGTTIQLPDLAAGDYDIIITSDQPNSQGNYTIEVVVSECEPIEDCLLYCGINPTLEGEFETRPLQNPLGGFITLNQARIILRESCFQDVVNLEESVLTTGDICGEGIRTVVNYRGNIVNHDGDLEKVDLLTQIYKEVQTPFDSIRSPLKVELPCGSSTHPDSIYNYFYGVDGDFFTDSVGIVHAYPHLVVRADLDTTRYVRFFDKEIEVLVHYLYNIDTVKVERLINDEWLLVELINKELRDSIRIDAVRTAVTYLNPFNRPEKYCGFNVEYSDVEVEACGGGVKVIRTWQALDWCQSEIKPISIQTIENTDQTAPVIEFAETDTTSIEAFSCAAIYKLPDLGLKDNCTPEDQLTVVWRSSEGRIADGYAVDLWESPTPIQLTAEVRDICGNETEHTINLVVEDQIAPTAVCADEIEVTITDGGLVILNASVFDNGSHDFGCGDVWVKAIRQENLRGTANGYWNTSGADRQVDYALPPDPSFTFRYTCSNEDADDFRKTYIAEDLKILGVDIGKQVFYDDEVGFCCADVDEEDLYVMVRIFDRDPGTGPVDPRRMEQLEYGPIYVNDRRFKKLVPTLGEVENDLYGHFTDCWVKVNFADKREPQLTCQNYEIDCLSDLSTIPNATSIGGICGQSAIQLASETELVNDCGNGDILREWFIDADDSRDLSDGDPLCIQIISVTDGPGQFDPYSIKWPKHMDDSSLVGINIECSGDSIYMENIQVPMGSSMNCIPSFDSDQAIWCDPLCSLVGYSIDVDTIEAAEACLKIIRNHVIIDWCTWEPNSDNPELDSDSFRGVEDWAQGDCINCPNGQTPIAGGAEHIYVGYTDVDIDGYYSYAQVLKVVDNTVPDILVQDTFFIDIVGQGDKAGLQDCEASGIIYAVAEDFCGSEVTSAVLLGWDVVVYNSANEVLYSEFQLTDTFMFDAPAGGADDQFVIEWTVRDGCGNLSTASSTIVFLDIAAPTPLCVQGVTTAFLQEDEVTIWAKDFDLGSFDACGDISFTIVSRGAAPVGPGEPAFEDQQSIIIECQFINDIAQFDVWVWDESGNGERCPVSVVINEECEDDSDVLEGSALIAGFIQTENGDGVEIAEVKVQSDLPEYPVTTVTNDAGAFSFINNPYGTDFEINVFKNTDYLNGVSTADLVAIQRHILNQNLLDSPYKVIAADVNSDESISALDIITLRNVILGLSRRFANNTSWRFVDASQIFSDIQNPWPFNETIQIDNLSQAMIDQNFIGAKIGDVNGTVVANTIQTAKTRHTNTSYFSIRDSDLRKNDIIYVPVMKDGDSRIDGFQFTLDHPNLELLSVESGDATITEAHFGRHQKATTFSYSESSMTIDSEVLFTLVFKSLISGRVTKEINISSGITPAEAYTAYGNQTNHLELKTLDHIDTSIELYQNTPNPFSGTTSIEFFLPQDTDATIVVYSSQGQEVFKINDQFSKGLHSIRIGEKTFNTSGIYYYELKTPKISLYKKMMFLK